MKRVSLLILFLVGLSFNPSKVVAQSGSYCCFNTVLEGYVCFTYILVETNGTSTRVGVPGIRVPCPQI